MKQRGLTANPVPKLYLDLLAYFQGFCNPEQETFATSSARFALDNFRLEYAYAKLLQDTFPNLEQLTTKLESDKR